jgi:hypothetical protein
MHQIRITSKKLFTLPKSAARRKCREPTLSFRKNILGSSFPLGVAIRFQGAI